MATYKEIKGVTIQTLDSDPVIGGAAGATWATSTSINTARQSGGSAGTATSAIFMSGTPTPAAVETWNGSSWTEVAELNTARITGGSTGFTGTAAIYAGGEASGPTANVETWDGSSFTETTDTPVSTRASNMFGSSTASVLTGGATGSPGATSSTSLLWNGSSWTSITEMGTDRNVGMEAGISTLGIIATGGYDPGQTISNVEQWNGSAWTEVSDVNTARAYGISSIAAGYNSYIICSGAPIDASPLKANTEFWDGSSWTEVADLASAARSSGGSGNSSVSALIFGGLNPSVTTDSFEWAGAPPTAAILTEGDLFLSGGTTLKGFGKAAGIPSATWASGGALNTARRRLLGSGIQTASIAVAGYSTAAQALAEQYNGSSWTEVSDLNTQRDSGGMAGGAPYTATIYFGGGNSPGGNSALAETWDGSSWTETGDLNTARNLAVGFGASQTAALGAGGETPPVVASTELWDGTSWTEVNNMNTARAFAAGTGPTSVGIVFGGEPPSTLANAEKWDGTSWTETGDLNTGRTSLAGSGSQTLALAFGGKSPAVGNTENFNGTSWTEVNDLSTVRGGGPMGVGSAVTAIAAGGNNPGGNLSSTEEFTADNALSTVTVS